MAVACLTVAVLMYFTPPAFPSCPIHGEGSHVIPWEYGYPDFKNGKRSKGGGCVIGENSPKWQCEKCGWNWGRYHDK
jgi:hypothetical protein